MLPVENLKKVQANVSVLAAELADFRIDVPG